MPMLKPSFTRLGNLELTVDRTIAALIILSAFVFAILSIYSGRYGINELIILITVPVFYLIFRKKISLGGELPKLQFSNRIRVISHIVFLISISLSIWLLWSNLYYRPPLYFAMLLVAAFSIILNIFCLEEKGSYAIVPLVKIVVLSLSVYAGIYYEFSGIYGVDPWWHNIMIEETVNLGHVTEGELFNNAYYLFPMFHLTAAVTQILTSLSSYSSVFLSTGALMAVSCVFVFLVSKKLFSTKTGLIAALIIPLTNYFIDRATAIIPMSLGVCFFAAIFYLIFYQDEKRSFKYKVLIIVLSVSMILTHAIPALVTLLSFIAIYIGIRWYKRITKPSRIYELIPLSLIALFAIVMLLWWMQPEPWGGSFFDFHLSTLAEWLQRGLRFLPVALELPSGNPFIIRLNNYLVSTINEGGFLLLLAFAIIGALIYLHPRNRTGPRIALILTAAILIGIPRGAWLFQSSTILPSRWFIFQCIPVSILAIQGLLGVFNLIRGSLAKLSLIMITVLIILFMTTTANRQANNDSPLFDNDAVRIGYTESEIGAITTLSSMGVGRPMTDLYYGSTIRYVISNENYTEMMSRLNNVFILRNYFLNDPELDNTYEGKIGWANEPSDYFQKVVIMDYLHEQGIDKGPLIYDNGKVKVYAIP